MIKNYRRKASDCRAIQYVSFLDERAAKLMRQYICDSFGGFHINGDNLFLENNIYRVKPDSWIVELPEGGYKVMSDYEFNELYDSIEEE